MVTDVQILFLGTPLVPLIIRAFVRASASFSALACAGISVHSGWRRQAASHALPYLT